MGRTTRSAVLVGFALVAVAGCGDPATSSGESVPRSTATTTAPTVAPTTQPTDTGNEGGFGVPAAAEGEFTVEYEQRFGGELQLADDGCWLLTTDSGSGTLIFPPGFAYGADPTEIVTPEGVTLRDGDRISGRGAAQYGLDQLPGGADGKWGNYLTFCDQPNGALVATQLAAEFSPTREEAEGLVASLDAGQFVTDWGCGFGFVTSTAGERVSLQLWFEGTDSPAAGPVELPAPGWRAELVVGDNQFANWCDDVLEWFEASPDEASTHRFELVSGRFTMPDTGASTWCTRPETVDVEAVAVALPEFDVDLGPIRIENPNFGCFAG